MTGREEQVGTFLAAAGWADATLEHLAGDLSPRRYARLRRTGGATAVLMDAAADQPVGPWLRVAGWLRSIGVHPPAVLAADEAAGLLLLEDLGDELVAHAIARGEDEAALYRMALDLLLQLQAHPPPSFLPLLDDPTLIRLLDLFLEFLTSGAPASAQEEFRAIWRALLPAARFGPDVFVHRDFHGLNLLVCPGADGRARLGVIDFQDAFRGPAVYDLISLLEDARRDVTPGVAEMVRSRYLAAHPTLDPAQFAAACAIIGAQRNLRILGIFERAARQLGRPHYREQLTPRVMVHLVRDLVHPTLAPMAAWLRAWAPRLSGA